MGKQTRSNVIKCVGDTYALNKLLNASSYEGTVRSLRKQTVAEELIVTHSSSHLVQSAGFSHVALHIHASPQKM